MQFRNACQSQVDRSCVFLKSACDKAGGFRLPADQSRHTVYTHTDANIVDPRNRKEGKRQGSESTLWPPKMAAHLSQARVGEKANCSAKASITVWLGILTEPGMQKSEVKKFSCCLNLGTMLLRSLQFPKQSAHQSIRGEAGKEETWKVQGLIFLF